MTRGRTDGASLKGEANGQELVQNTSESLVKFHSNRTLLISLLITGTIAILVLVFFSLMKERSRNKTTSIDLSEPSRSQTSNLNSPDLSHHTKNSPLGQSSEGVQLEEPTLTQSALQEFDTCFNKNNFTSESRNINSPKDLWKKASEGLITKRIYHGTTSRTTFRTGSEGTASDGATSGGTAFRAVFDVFVKESGQTLETYRFFRVEEDGLPTLLSSEEEKEFFSALKVPVSEEYDQFSASQKLQWIANNNTILQNFEERFLILNLDQGIVGKWRNQKPAGITWVEKLNSNAAFTRRHFNCEPQSDDQPYLLECNCILSE